MNFLGYSREKWFDLFTLELLTLANAISPGSSNLLGVGFKPDNPTVQHAGCLFFPGKCAASMGRHWDYNAPRNFLGFLFLLTGSVVWTGLCKRLLHDCEISDWWQTPDDVPMWIPEPVGNSLKGAFTIHNYPINSWLITPWEYDPFKNKYKLWFYRRSALRCHSFLPKWCAHASSFAQILIRRSDIIPVCLFTFEL